LAGNLDDADDLVQTACERAIRNIDQWQSGTRLDSWMYRIIQTAWIDLVRSRQTREAHVNAVVALASHAAAGEGDALNRLTLRSVQAALERLPDEQRLVVLLVCVEELSYVEAAEVLAVPVGTIMSRLARGRLALRQLVEGQRGDPETIRSQDQVNVR
jgi:RNA polymerase sigma-70 factor (ECF subfamily)